MSTYCRITGKSRGLPKPNYFPLLPPISPADAKRFCRITGKSYGLPAHHYIPVLVGRKKSKSDTKHVLIKGYRYVFPVVDGCCSELSDVLTKSKCNDDDDDDGDGDGDGERSRRYVYAVDKRRCSLVFPGSLEKAVRVGDVRDVMLSETSDTVLLKLREGKTVELEVKDVRTVAAMTLMEGEGFRNRPKTTAGRRKTGKDDWRRKIFEEKEKESDAELEQEELKSKRIKFSAGQGKQMHRLQTPKILSAKSLNVSKVKNLICKPNAAAAAILEDGSDLRLHTDVLPAPISIQPSTVDLGSAFPGVVHQTFLNDTAVTGLPVVPVISPIQPVIKNFNKLPVVLPDAESCVIEEILTEDNVNKLLTVQEISALIENIQSGVQETIPTCRGNTKIFKIEIDNAEKYVPGQYVKTENGEKFVPGKFIETENGKEFVYGIMVQTLDGPKLLPGQIIEDSGKSVFIVGQNIVTREGESFVPGQTITVDGERKFVPGQTVITPEGIGFVAGQSVNNGDESHFVPGQTIMTVHGPQFVPGQFWNDENVVLEFTPGESVLKKNGDWEFVPGVCVAGTSFVPGLTVVVEEDRKKFIPGRIVETDGGDTSFVPGITTLDNNGNTKFVSGISIETEQGVKFVSGNILTDDHGNKQFVLGHVSSLENGTTTFVKAQSLQEAICSDEVQSGILTNNSFYPKGEKSDEVFGHMVQTAYGVEFYPGDKLVGLPAGKIVSGKLIRNNGIRFVPGVVVDDKFIPGQVVVTDRGEQFVPGQVIETQTGPKFVPGQVVETETGSKFVPGQTIETKDGIQFVPGQIVETKAGPTFIPGQIIYTEEEGSRFVPGQVVDTIEGPRFVPGRVIETGDCVTFVPGQVVETTEGLRFVAPDLQDADDGGIEFSVQGFEISPEELRVIQPSFPQSSYYVQNGEMALDSKMLAQLSLAGMSIGRQVPAELPEVDVSTLPSMEVAYEVAEKLEFNNDNTIKLAHIINRLCKLDVKNTYYGSPLVRSLIKKLPPVKSNENVAEVIENVLNSSKTSPISALNEIYVVIFDDGFVTDLKNPNKVNILKGIMNSSSELEYKYIAEAFSEILNDSEDSKLRSAFEHIAAENIELLKEVKLKINTENVNTEKEAVEALQWAIVNVINTTSDIAVNEMLLDNKSEQFNRLLSDAVGLAKALGLREVVSVLMDVLHDRRSADILASDKITVEILRRLTVMRKLAEKRPEFGETLNGMFADPIEARLDPKLRELVRESGVLLLPPEANVESSFDVPAELFGSGNSLAMEDFMLKSRKMGILLIIKNGLQAVVPREAARSVLTGQVAYTVLDETGMHRFEPMNVLDALNIRAYSSGRYSMYNCAVHKTLTEDEGTLTRGSSISLDDRQLTIGEGGGEEYEVLRDYETDPVDGADEEDELILEPGDRVVLLKQSKDDPSMGDEVKRNLLLDNAAAKHKMAIRPNRVHPTKHKPVDTDGSLVQSIDEPTKMGYVPNSILKKIPAPARATAVVPEEGHTLSKKDAKFNRDVVLAELVETEEEFGQDIQEVVDRYLSPLESNLAPRIVRDNKDLIFNNLKQISQFHNTVLISGLKYAASEPKTMGRTFLRLERDFDKHVNYCQTEPDAQEFLEFNYEVREYFEDERLKFGDDKALSEHLKLPIQRINDYQLLLKELVKYSLLIGEDTTDLERALELMLSIPHRFTDTKFLSNIEGFHGTIHKLGRLLKHGWYYVQDAEDPKGHQRYCFLFKSRILVCKVRRISEDRSVFVLKDIIRLPDVTVKVAPDNKRVWVLHHNQGEVGNYPFTFRSNEDGTRDQWITEIEEHKNDLREKEDLQEQFWEQEYISITKSTKSSITVTNIEHNSDDIKIQKQKDEDSFEPLKGIELDISSEIEEGLDPIERRLAPKPLKHVEEPKRPPLTLPPKEPIFECTSPPEPKPRQEPEIVKVEEPPVVEMPVPQGVSGETKEVPIPEIPAPAEPPPPERSPSPADEVIEPEPLKYTDGVSRPYFHVNIKGTSHGVGENAVFECEIEGAKTVTWLKNNLPLPSSVANRTTITEDKDKNLYKLQINKVILSDSGTYTVKAENDIGESTSTALLFVENLSADEKKARAKANAPIFAVKLADTQLLENTHARFIIEIKGNPSPKLRFFKGDREITEGDLRVQILDVSKEKGIYELIIPDVKPEDAGEYRVVASNKYSEESCTCQVTVTNEKDLWAGMQTEVPDGAPKFTWLKNGKPFNPEERFKVLFREDEDSLALVFQHVKPEDAGLYTCIASTCRGKISCSAELSVQGVVKELNLPYAPRVTTETNEIETKIKSTAIFEAKVIGDPVPDIVWFKNGNKITENERIKMMYEDDIAALVVKNVEVEDEGEYKIFAKNDLGSDSETINLLIKAAPKFKKNLTDYEGVTGVDITLTVEIEASPKPIVQWYKDSKVIKKSNRIKYVTDEVSGTYTLIIEDCKMEDVGLYSVVASNEFSQISDACRVNLQMPPQFIGALAKEVETLEGDYVSLSVRVEGDPPPQVKWYFEDKLLVADKSHIKINAVDDVHTLLISNLTREDSGKYRCEINNEFGKNSCEGQLRVKCPPIFETPLTDKKAVEGDTNVEFTVKLNSYPKSSVQWFHEEEKITETTTEFTCVEDGDTYKLIIKEAKTNLSGTYKCRATNEIGTYDSEATLTVMSHPTFKKGLKDMEVTEGGMLKLQVTCYGSPLPDIKWYKDGKEVHSDAHIKISKDKKRVENFSLTVNLVKVEDGGEYEVRATNEMGTAVTKSIVTIQAMQSADFKDDENETEKSKTDDINENVNKKEKVLLPIDINCSDRTRERFVEKFKEEDRKMGVSAIGNIDGDRSSFHTEESVIIMSSQSGDFSCMEISWEESSSKCKNYYGVVEEPKEERIIPIKIDRGISIHTASDEEDEPFWVVESVKKHEEVRNEIKKMKENKTPQASLAESFDEDDDNSLKELLKRVQKQRNDLGDILERENHNTNLISDARLSERTLSRSNSILSEASTLKDRSISRLSSLNESIKAENNEISDNVTNDESISSSFSTNIRTKEHYSLITDNISKTCTVLSTENLDRREKGVSTFHSSTDTTENDSPLHSRYSIRKNSDIVENSVSCTVKKPPVSRFSSKEESDNLTLTKQINDEYAGKSKRESLSRVSTFNSSTDTIENDSPVESRYSVRKNSNIEDSVSCTVKKPPVSRFSSKEESDNLTLTKTIKDEYAGKSKRESLSREFSYETNDESSIPRNSVLNEYSEKTKRKSLLASLSYSENSSQEIALEKSIQNNKLNDESNKILEENLNDYRRKSSLAKNNSLNKSTEIPENNFGKDRSYDSFPEKRRNSNLSESSALQTFKSDEADSRRKSLIKQSSMLSDALNAMCNEIPEDSNYRKQKRLSNVDDDLNKREITDNSGIFKEEKENNLSNPSKSLLELENSAKPLTSDEVGVRDSSGRKSSVTSIVHDSNVGKLKSVENESVPESGDEKYLNKTNDKLDNIPAVKKYEILNTETSKSPLNLDNIDKKTSSDSEDNDSIIILSPESVSNKADENIPSNKAILSDGEPQSAIDKSLPKSNKAEMSPKEYIDSDSTTTPPLESTSNKEDKNISSNKAILSDGEPQSAIDKSLPRSNKAEMSPKEYIDSDSTTTPPLESTSNKEDKNISSNKAILSDGKPQSAIDKSLPRSNNIKLLSKQSIDSDSTTAPSLEFTLNKDDKKNISSNKAILSDGEPQSAIDDERLPRSNNIKLLPKESIDNDLTTIPYPESIPNKTDENNSLNKEILSNCEPNSAIDKSLPKSSETKMLSKESILTDDIAEQKRTENDLYPDNLIDASLISNKEKNTNNQKIPLKEDSVNEVEESKNTESSNDETDTETLEQPLAADSMNNEDEDKTLRLKSLDAKTKENITENTKGIKTIGVPPKIISGMKDVENYESLTQVFNVKAIGNPKPKAQWFKDGEELSNTRNIQITDEDDETFKLTIQDLRVADSGSYCCKLTNEVGEDAQTAKLKVQDVESLRGPKIKKPLSDAEVVLGEKVVWSITLVADPVPEVEWTCDGKKVNADFTVDSVDIANDLKECTYTMTIPTSELSDTGVYRVKATNKFDSAECSARLDIVMKPVIEGFHDVTVIPSMEAQFEAIIKAVPKPKIVWTVNGKDLAKRELVKLTSEEIDNDVVKFKITIGNVNPEEEGEYVVKAWNKVGETTAVANLKLHTEAPSFVKLLEDKTIQDYEEVQLSVRVNGIPKPKITWFKNGEVVIPDPRISIITNEEGQVKSTLTIDHFSNLDVAKFSVKAVNMIGEDETSSNLTMAEIMPSFVKPFERISEAVEGLPIELETQLIGSPRPQVAWYKDGEELKSTAGDENSDEPKHITLEANPNGSVLIKIDKVEQRDCGAYKIIATNKIGTSNTNTALVVTESPKTPIIIKHPKNVDIKEGEVLKIEAQYVAYPDAIVKWYKDGHVLHPCPQLDFVLGPNGNIALVNEKSALDDAGNYEVVVSNDLGKATAQIEVRVKPAATEPVFITPLRDSKVVEGFPAKIPFKLSGFPLPKLEWTINDKPLVVDGEKIKMVHEPDGLHYLLIEKASPDHAGKLIVTALNDNGKSASEAKLSVTPKVSSDTSESKPVFLNELKDTTVEESNTLTLLAPFLGNPIPDVQWEKDGKILQPCNKVHFTCDGYKVGLEVLDTNTGDAGKYTCTLTNKLGSAVSGCQVGVRKIYQAPVFTQRFSHNQQVLSRDAKFHARVTGVPSPSIIWHKNGHQITNGDKYKIKRDGEVCSLTIRDVNNDDAGLYSCIATNRDGTATCEAQLSIAPRNVDESRKQEPPSFMKKIGDCEVYDGMTAKFTACATGWPEPEYEWFLDTNRLYETERIRMEKEGSGLLRLKILHADSVIDSGRYKLRIYNPHGEAYCEASIIFDNGLDSRSKRPVGELYKDYDRYRATGAPLPLPDPPTIIRMTDKRLTLSWRPSLPITPRAPVTYLVEMEEQPKGEWSTVRAGIRGCLCDVHGLIPFRDYKFRVRVENNYGISDPSPFVLTYREKLEPDPPRFTPYLPPGTDFRPDSSPYFPKDFDIERPPHDNYAQAPRFLHQEHDTQYGIKGHNVNLYWFVYGYPKPKMQYYFDNQLVEMGGRYDSSYTRNGQATLFINKMLDRDIGTYEAVATNEHGTARQRVRLQIAEYPKFLKRPEEMYVALRKNCKLEARVVGVPYPEIKWFKDWKPLVDSARIQIEQVEPDVCLMRIEDIIMKDEGLYSISARNLAGSISTSVAIHVEDRESDYSYNGKTDFKWKNKPLSDLYDIGDELGRGTQGVVYHAVERSTGRSYAAKIMHAKGDHLTKLMDNELRIMSDLSNRRIIRIHEALQTGKTYTLITELAGGGELLDVLTKHSYLTEYDISLYIIQLLKSLKYMHDFEIGHLGLTPGDLLISHPGGDTLKLCDFGLSRKINRRKLEPVDYGMPEFISPEIARGEGVDLSTDLWSVGVITHLLLTGVSLFRCVNDANTLDRVKSGSYTLSTKISDLARDFISKLLVINPKGRLDVISALQHPWLQQYGEDVSTETSRINTDCLRNYYNNFKDWYSNASCRNWYRRRPLSSAYTHPSKMIYPPGLTWTPSPTPEPEPKKNVKHVPSWKDKLPPKEPIDTEIGIVKSESHYQYGPDTYLLQLRDTNFPVRLREYMKVAGKSLTYRGGSDSHLDWEAPVIRERRKFTDIMDEEIEDEQKARISQYGADIYTLRRLKQEIGSRPTAHVEAEAILESRIDGQPPFFREKPQKLPIEPDKPADLMCLAVGVPKPIVQWFKNDIVLAESHRIKMLEDNDGRSILRLDPATELDLGIYKVVARNKFGQTTARARLVLAREPGPMDAPEVKEYSDTEILLRWDYPKQDGNAPILCYQLEIRENESDWELVAKNIDHEFWLMQNLRAYTNYEFRLTAMNHIGWGPTGPASPIVRTHFPDAKKLEVPSAMLNLQIITESGREIIGDEPRNNLDYSLEYKPVDWSEQPPIEKYRFISEIARGRFSVVLKGINTSNDSIIVAKLLEISPTTEAQVTHEFNVLKTLRHERIAYLIEGFKLENAPVAVFIQEKLQGADILTYLSTKEHYSEQTVANIVTQVLDALQYLHWRGYAHLDLQPDNIVMSSVRTVQVKLIDFGCARKVSKLGAVVGANSVLEFTAPEILCDEPAYPYSDIWSLGVIAYTLLSGMSPFRGTNDTETRQNITFVRYRFEYLYKDLSQEATRFLMLLFKRTPTKRPSAEECHEHRWLLPTEYMIKKREKTMFSSYKLQSFAKEYHENRTKSATSSQKLLSALGTRQVGLGRSNSVVDELLIFK